MESVILAGTSAADGSLTLTSRKVSGYIEKVWMDYGTAATTADLVLTAEQGGLSEAILTLTDAGVADVLVYPRVAPVSVAKAAITNAYEKIHVDGTLKLVVAQAGDAKTVRVVVFLSD